MTSKTWRESMRVDEAIRVEQELKGIGLESNQIESLMKHRGKVTGLELSMMLSLPRNERSGKKATISVVQSALRTAAVLGLIEKKPRRKQR